MSGLRFARPRTPADARALQSRLAARVIAEDRLGPVRRVAGADATYDAARGMTRAAVAVLAFPDLTPVAESCALRRTDFPYLTGLLSFREAPAVLEALAGLRRPPDLLLVDGHGLAHPRRFGLASHLGVIADLPTIGVAKSRLVGEYREPGPARGGWTRLYHRGEVVGAVVRTRAQTRPVFVSVGHRVSLASAVELVLACAPRYRLPEPIRAADRLSRRRA